MQKVFRALGAVAGRILFLGFAVQIVLGICWMVMNFLSVQGFGESILYGEISKTLICDEYEGILYPVLILLSRGIEELFLIPYHCILYLLQMGVAFFAGYRFLKCVGVKQKLWLIGGSLAMLTFPMAMQCHLAVLPDSLVASCLLLELSFGLEMILSGQPLNARKFVKVLCVWLVGSLLQPGYFFPGGIPVVLVFLYGNRNVRLKACLYNGMIMLAFAGMIMGVHDLTQLDGYYGRTRESVGLAMASRCAWPNFSKDYESWPEEIKAYVTRAEVVHVDYYADNVERLLGRSLEEAVGVERTEELLWEIAKVGWQRHRNAILHDAAWDVVGYTFSPLVVQRQFTGKAYDSYSGRNYDIMRMNTPQLTEAYFDYGCRWFAAALAVAALLWTVVLLREKGTLWNRKWAVALVGWILTAAGIAFYYTMRGAGMMDYKKSVAVTLLWIVWMLAAAAKESINEREKNS